MNKKNKHTWFDIRCTRKEKNQIRFSYFNSQTSTNLIKQKQKKISVFAIYMVVLITQHKSTGEKYI